MTAAGDARASGGWREYDRLISLGVDVRAARILAGLVQWCGTERGYWRHLRHGRRPDSACRAAHTLAQRQRRAG